MPSKHAIKAAQAVIDGYDPTACTQMEYESDIDGAAELIDAETGLPELLEIVRALYAAKSKSTQALRHAADEYDDMARAALRKTTES